MEGSIAGTEPNNEVVKGNTGYFYKMNYSFFVFLRVVLRTLPNTGCL